MKNTDAVRAGENDSSAFRHAATHCGSSLLFARVRITERLFRSHNSHIAERGSHRLGDVAAGQVRVIALSNAGVSVAELLGDHLQRHAAHCEPAGVSVAELVEG